MTGEAAADDLRVINPCDGSPTDSAVAVLADICGLYMGRVFTGGVHAIVTTEATARDVRVVEYGRLPRTGLVTVVAAVAGNNVARWFAARDHVVVARAATAGDSSVIHESDRAPGADLRALHVLCPLSRCLHGTDRGMAADAVRARALESAARMTAFAGDVDMGAVEIEARAEMIERLLAERLTRPAQGKAENNQQ